MLRDLKSSCYLRQEQDGILVGPYEHLPTGAVHDEWGRGGPPKSWASSPWKQHRATSGACPGTRPSSTARGTSWASRRRRPTAPRRARRSRAASSSTRRRAAPRSSSSATASNSPRRSSRRRRRPCAAATRRPWPSRRRVWRRPSTRSAASARSRAGRATTCAPSATTPRRRSRSSPRVSNLGDGRVFRAHASPGRGRAHLRPRHVRLGGHLRLGVQAPLRPGVGLLRRGARRREARHGRAALGAGRARLCVDSNHWVWGVPTKLQNSLSRSNRRRFG